MVDTKRIGTRTKELLEVFSKAYVKGYKTALVQSLRAESVVAVEIDRPPFELLPPEDESGGNGPPATLMESSIYVGKKFGLRSHWVMLGNYMVKEVGAPSAGSSGCCTRSAPVEPEQEPPAADSSTSSAAVPDLRIWVDNKTTTMCMNKDCSEEVSKPQNCPQCGSVYCKKCLSGVHGDGKTVICVVCDTAAKSNHPSSKLPLLKDPGKNQRYLNFFGYEVELHASERLSKAGASTVGDAIRPDGSEGKFLLILKHARPTRPTITVAFEREDLRDKWRARLETASRKAPEPITDDPILRSAFESGYNQLRWEVCMWSGWTIDGNESELLADVITHTLEREFLGAELAKIPAEFAKTAARNAARKVITAAITPCWAGLMKGLSTIRPPIEKAAGSMLGPIFEAENKIKGKVSQPMEEAAKKLIGLVETQLQEQFGSKMAALPAFAEAQITMVSESVKSLVQEVQQDVDQSPATFWKAFDRIIYDGQWTWWGSQRKVSWMLWEELYFGDSSNGLTNRLYWYLIEDGIKLNQATFKALKVGVLNAEKASATKAGGASLLQYLRQIYPTILQQLANDLSWLIIWRLNLSLDSELRPLVMEKTSQVIGTITQPLDSLIPDLIKDVIDPKRTCLEIINDQVIQLEKGIVQAATAKSADQIKGFSAKASLP